MKTAFHQLLVEMGRLGASDLFLSVGAPPSLKINGRMVQVGDQVMQSPALLEMIHDVIPAPAKRRFEAEREANFAFAPDGLPRFRANAFFQRNTPSMVIRQIRADVPTRMELGLPPIIDELSLLKRGIVFVVGATGTGKSTTLASMVHQRNLFGSGHIITVEDPIEFTHKHGGCIVTQREVGVDTDSFEAALTNTLRQAPDCIVIGEIRSKETMQQAITFAETGHLCLATLHANNANQAIERILHFFPSDEHDRIRLDLSLNLKAIVAQQLMPNVNRNGMALACEVLLNSPLVSEKIRTNEIHVLKAIMAKGGNEGMQTFDQSLFQLYRDLRISYESALSHADSVNDLRLKIKLSRGSAPTGEGEFARAGLKD